MGILKIAPALVLTVSPLTGAPPFFWMMIPETPVHSAVLMMAPKLRTSLNWSNKRNKGTLPDSITDATNSSNGWNSIGAICATAPWWFILVNRFNFSTGTYEAFKRSLWMSCSNSVKSSPRNPFCRNILSIFSPDFIASMIARMPKMVVSFSMG